MVSPKILARYASIRMNMHRYVPPVVRFVVAFVIEGSYAYAVCCTRRVYT